MPASTILLATPLDASDGAPHPADPCRLGTTLARRVADALEPGEQLVWVDCPDPARCPTGLDAALVAALGFTLLGLVCLVDAWRVGLPVMSATSLAGIAVLLAVPIHIVHQLFASKMAARWTVYALTDRRVIVIEGRSAPRVATYTPRELCVPRLTRRQDGSGTVVVAIERRAGRPADVALVGVRDLERVHALVRGLRDRPARERDANL